MGKEWKLTPMELVFSGKLLHAKYIDYDYFAAMPDIQINRELREQETMEKLEEDGIIEMDFYDHAEFDEEVREVLLPVFFGETESRLMVDEQPVYHFHVHQGTITMAVLEEDVITLRKVEGDDEIRDFLKGEKVVVQCANVHTGQRDRVFTSEELEDEDMKTQAVNLLKGEA